MTATMLISKCKSRKGDDIRERNFSGEDGIALIISVIALLVLSLLGLYMSLNATTEVRISDNFESRIQASFAAQAGLTHAREAVRGLPIGVHLKGPDGTNSAGAYLTTARTFAFRNPLSWALARSLNVANPAAALSGLPDDGVINTGPIGGVNGTAIIPLAGVVWSKPNPNGGGSVVIGRYFVKVTDNNGEASEVAVDPSDNPFVDGDHIVIVRSMGIAGTIREDSGGTVRRNSVVVYETRLKQRTTFELDAPFVVEGNQVLPSGPKMWDGNAFKIDGGASNYGIATIDTNTGDTTLPAVQIGSQLASNQANRIMGMGSSPSIADITSDVASDPDKSLLMDPNFLWQLVHDMVPQFADTIVNGDTKWSGGDAPDLGFIDLSKPANDPSQRPRVTLVNGNLDIGGNLSGGGLLVVTGKLGGNGSLNFNGLILVIGQGDLDGSGLNVGINGGILLANVTQSGTGAIFGTPKFTWRGNSNITMNDQAVRMSVEMLPPVQLSWREITSAVDP